MVLADVSEGVWVCIDGPVSRWRCLVSKKRRFMEKEQCGEDSVLWEV